MNVIGIVQTDLNEFSVLFEPESRDQKRNHNDSGGFFHFGDDGSGDDQNDSEPQELTVRIKGVPEGQKATFLQMYQILQDAKEMKDLEENLTIISRGDEQENHGQGRQNRRQ